MFNVIQRLATRIALPFNLVAFVGVFISAWVTWQNSGFNFTVWLPVVLVSISLTISFWAKPS